MAKISLTATATSHGVTYTPAEKRFFAAALTTTLGLAGVQVAKPVTDNAAEAAVKAVLAGAEQDMGVASIVAAAYRGHAKANESADFPKQRDPTSIRLLTRAAIVEIGCESLLEQVAPKYGKKSA